MFDSVEYTCASMSYAQWLDILDKWAFDLFGAGVSDMPDLWCSRDAYDDGFTVRDGLIQWADLQAVDSSLFAEIYEDTDIPS